MEPTRKQTYQFARLRYADAHRESQRILKACMRHSLPRPVELALWASELNRWDKIVKENGPATWNICFDIVGELARDICWQDLLDKYESRVVARAIINDYSPWSDILDAADILLEREGWEL